MPDHRKDNLPRSYLLGHRLSQLYLNLVFLGCQADMLRHVDDGFPRAFRVDDPDSLVGISAGVVVGLNDTNLLTIAT